MYMLAVNLGMFYTASLKFRRSLTDLTLADAIIYVDDLSSTHQRHPCAIIVLVRVSTISGAQYLTGQADVTATAACQPACWL